MVRALLLILLAGAVFALLSELLGRWIDSQEPNATQTDSGFEWHYFDPFIWLYERLGIS
jgi:hypothetical protein